MALVENTLRLVLGRLPKVVSPRTHAAIDYAVAAAFVAVGLKTWKRNKRVAIPALLIGGSQVALSLLTDYPGGVTDALELEKHLEIDALRAGVIASLPGILEFPEAWQSRFFRGHGMAIAAVAGLTETKEENISRSRYHSL
ncbi:MAG: hypothetical protein ABSD20_00425 [Terriglobales bacterium]|jgi:hypothetical protein